MKNENNEENEYYKNFEFLDLNKKKEEQIKNPIMTKKQKENKIEINSLLEESSVNALNHKNSQLNTLFFKPKSEEILNDPLLNKRLRSQKLYEDEKKGVNDDIEKRNKKVKESKIEMKFIKDETDFDVNKFKEKIENKEKINNEIIKYICKKIIKNINENKKKKIYKVKKIKNVNQEKEKNNNNIYMKSFIFISLFFTFFIIKKYLIKK